MSITKKIGITMILYALCVSMPAAAETGKEELLREIEALHRELRSQEERIRHLEERISQYEKEMPSVQLSDMTIEDFDKHLDAHILHRMEGYSLLGGLRVAAGSTFIIQGAHNANGDALSKKGEDVTDASYSIDLELEKEFEDYGKAFLHIETGDGAGVEDELQVFSNVNRDADDSDNAVNITEVWYEHYFKGIPLKVMFGKIDGTILIDTNKYANDETTQFLGRAFRNSPVIEFPDNGPGIRLEIEPADFMDITLLAMDGDSDCEDIAGDNFYAAQFNLRPQLFSRDGNYRLITWLSTRDHTEWNNPYETKKYLYGFGLSLDQELNENTGIFVRCGWEDPDEYLNGESFSLESAWSAGIQLKGAMWGRDNDKIGIAIGQIFPSHEYKDAGSGLKADSEGHFETYYNYKVNEHLVLSPDIQLIWKPYGNDAANGDATVAVAGMRGQLDF